MARSAKAGLVLRSAQREAGWLADRSCALRQQPSFAKASEGIRCAPRLHLDRGRLVLRSAQREAGWRMGWDSNPR